MISRIIPQWALIAGLVASHGVVGVKAWQWGGERVEARVAAEVEQLRHNLDDVAAATLVAEMARLEAEAERDALAQEFEDAIRERPDASDIALPADLVREINSQ